MKQVDRLLPNKPKYMHRKWHRDLPDNGACRDEDISALDQAARYHSPNDDPYSDEGDKGPDVQPKKSRVNDAHHPDEHNSREGDPERPERGTTVFLANILPSHEQPEVGSPEAFGYVLD
jgi:hypothetical protein